MGKIIITVGISGSGKSTYAHTLWNTNPSNYVIVCRDKIRELLFGFTESNISETYWDSRKDLRDREKEVTKFQDVLINEALNGGKIPIVDATHLTKAYINAFRIWNVPVEFVTFEAVSVDTAFERIQGRVRKLSKETLQKQQNQLNTLMSQMKREPKSFDFTPLKLINNKKLPSCVVVDVDNTLAHMVFRNPYDWHRVGEDEVDQPTANLVRDLKASGNVKIIICTGRDGICLPETEKWLQDNKIPYDGIFIRENKDQRADWIVKEEMWRKLTQIYHIEYLIDDRNQVVRRARALNLKVFQAEYGNF